MSELPELKLYVLDENHQPVETTDWQAWASHLARTRFVDYDKIGLYTVSTIFLGITPDHDEDGKPMLWETMVFKGGVSDRAYIQERASCLENAVALHAILVRDCRKLSSAADVEGDSTP